MFEMLAARGRETIGGLIEWFRDPDFAYGIATFMAIVAIAMVVCAIVLHLLQKSALKAKQLQLSGFVALRGAQDTEVADAREAEFFRRFREIDAAMQKSGAVAGQIAHAWRRYRKTLIVGHAAPIRSSQRPAVFFYRTLTPPTWLGFAATMFVGFGLLVTFLGLVAALTFASEGMQSDAPDAMQAALRDLFSAASSKFVTSVAGVGLSLVLRLTERFLTISLRRSIDSLSGAIEFGVRVDPDAQNAALASNIAQLLGQSGPEARGTG